MIIRHEQLLAFQDQAQRRFEREMAEHLVKFAPRHAHSLGEGPLAAGIRLGIRNAKRHGFTLRGPVRLYLEMMFLFGSYFDSDIQYPWAQQAFAVTSATPEMVRAGDLHAKAMQYIAAIRGPSNVLLLNALRRLRGVAAELIPARMENVASEVANRLEDVYPEKYRYLGRDTLMRILDAAVDRARLAGFGTPLGEGLFGILAFELGSGFENDPLYPWVGQLIVNSASATPERRAKGLRQAAVACLDGALEIAG